MRRETLMKAMMVAISNVFETMFFLPVQFAQSGCTLREWFFDRQLLFGATLSFDGPSSGLLWIAAPVSLVDEITASFLGLGRYEINDEQRGDTIKEALNMMGGNVLSLFNEEGSFALGIPRSVEGISHLENTQGDPNEHSILIETKGNRLAAGIKLD
jgi:hypothetical protein